VSDKVIRDGLVAVLYSPGFGAGWSTWCDDDQRAWALYAPEIVQAVEEKRHDDIPALTEAKWGARHFYCGGSPGLRIEWLPVGTRFIVNEYDGSESIQVDYRTEWDTA
jgi:hypothetical protein